MAQRPPDIRSELMEPVASVKGNSFKYVAFWAVMACFGASYLAAASIRPAFLAGYLPVADSGASEAAERNAAEIVNVRDTMHQLQTEMTSVGERQKQQVEETRSLSERIAALEQKPSTAASASEPPQRVGAAHPETHNGTDFPTDLMPGPGEHAAAAPKATAKQQPKVINAPLETGSLTADQPAAPAKAAPAKPKAAAAPAAPKEKAEVGSFTEPKVTKPVGIKLATGGSVDNLRVSWGVLAERHGTELSALQPRYYNNADGSGITYELVAGPFKNTAEAKKVCQSLKAQAVDCQVSTFGGNAL